METSLLSRIKANIIHMRIRQLSQKDWNNRHKTIFKINKDYNKPCDGDIEKKHLEMWSKLRPDANVNTLRVCNAISGCALPEIVPEEVYVSEIEPCLNKYKEIAYIANKNFYNRWFPDGVFPYTYIHNIDGVLYDGEYIRVSKQSSDNLIKSLPYPVVFKPSLGPGGGVGVIFPKSPSELVHAMDGKINYVIQEKLKQHPFMGSYNDSSLNTFRVCAYRSVTDNSVHILNASMRMGKAGSLDNETAGGIVCGVMEDGQLNSYAVDKYGTKFYSHPDSNKDFSLCEKVPYYEDLIDLCIDVAENVYLSRVSSLDVCLDENGKWRIIEINLMNQTIRFSQYVGRPFFGRFTQEVLDYCQTHPQLR